MALGGLENEIQPSSLTGVKLEIRVVRSLKSWSHGRYRVGAGQQERKPV
jgi:hypothetical protein